MQCKLTTDADRLRARAHTHTRMSTHVSPPKTQVLTFAGDVQTGEDVDRSVVLLDRVH